MSAPTYVEPGDDDLEPGDATVILPATIAYTGMHVAQRPRPQRPAWQLPALEPETSAALIGVLVVIGAGLILWGLLWPIL